MINNFYPSERNNPAFGAGVNNAAQDVSVSLLVKTSRFEKNKDKNKTLKSPYQIFFPVFYDLNRSKTVVDIYSSAPSASPCYE